MICKAANGVADDMVSTIMSICEQPKLLVPAMNFRMWQNKATQKAVSKLRKNKAIVMDPDEGYLASLHKGEGRLPKLERVMNEIRNIFDISTPLKDKKVVITAGPTIENIDPVRFISNKSSGKMGYAFANTLINLGAEVTLISGPVSISPHPEASVIYIDTAECMYNQINEHLDADMIIMCAAISDYTPTKVSKEKLKRSKDTLSIDFKPTIDIIKNISDKTNALIIAFALETNDGEKNAKRKLINKGSDYIILNHPQKNGCGIDSNYNEVIIFDKNNNKKKIDKDRKDRIASDIMNYILQMENIK